MDEFYGKVTVQLDFQRFATVEPSSKANESAMG